MRKNFSFFLIGLLFIVSVHSISAHGLAVSQQKVVGDYVVEFEYDTTGKVVAGELTSFAFELLTNTPARDVAEYERVSVKLTKQDAAHPTFAANLLPVDILGRKSSRANITLSDIGSYTADLVFYKNNTEVARASFPFEVQANAVSAPVEKNNSRNGAYIGIFAALLIVIVAQTIWLVKKKKT